MSKQVISVKTTGSNGSASGTKKGNSMKGFLSMVKVDYVGAPGTTVVKLEEPGGRILLQLPAGNTDGVFYPTVLTHEVDGGETEVQTTPYIDGPVQVVVTNSNALNPAVRVTVQVA